MNLTFLSLQLASVNSYSPIFIDSPRRYFTQKSIQHSTFSRSFSNVMFFQQFYSSSQISNTIFSYILQSAVVVRKAGSEVHNCLLFPTGYDGNSALSYEFNPDLYPKWDDRRPYISDACSSPFSFMDCIFNKCYATVQGGALHFSAENSDLIMKRNTFIECKTTKEDDDTYGAGVRIEKAKAADILRCCFIDCTGPQKLIGPAITAYCKEKIILDYVGSVHSQETQRTNGPPFHIQTPSVQSQYINSTGAKSYKASGIIYLEVNNGFFKFHTISKCRGHNLVSLHSVSADNSVTLDFFNIESNVVDDDLTGVSFKHFHSSEDIAADYKTRLCYIWSENNGNGLKISHFSFAENRIELSQSTSIRLDETRIYNEYSCGNSFICDSCLASSEPSNIKSFYTFKGNTINGLTIKNSVEITKFPLFQEGECGIPTNSYTFSNSESFSLSVGFSKSDAFSKTTEFSQSTGFSKSDAFSKTTEFSQSTGFSDSNTHNPSDEFSHSMMFSTISIVEPSLNEPPHGSDPDDKGMPKGALIGLIVGIIIAVLIIIAIVILVILRKRKASTEEPSSEMNSIELQGVHTNDSIHVNDENNDDPFKEDYHEVHADPFMVEYND